MLNSLFPNLVKKHYLKIYPKYRLNNKKYLFKQNTIYLIKSFKWHIMALTGTLVLFIIFSWNLNYFLTFVGSIMIVTVIFRRSPSTNPEGTTGRQQEGKFVELPHAEMGKVIVRFPPEASGCVPFYYICYKFVVQHVILVPTHKNSSDYNSFQDDTLYNTQLSLIMFF